MSSSTDSDAPSVITSDVYNDAQISFSMLESKEKLVSFLDCTTLLRSMGMNPTQDDMDRMKELTAKPIARLEQWRREEELRQDKERRKEEARERKGKDRGSVAPNKKSIAEKPAAEDGAANAEAGAEAASLVPAEEIKNIDWNIFIHCAELVFRDRMREQHAVLEALKVFIGTSSAVVSRDRLMEIVTTNGDNVLTPAEVKLLVTMLPESCSAKELAARIQGTYVAPTQAELDAAAAREMEALRQQQEAAEKPKEEEDPLSGL